MSGRSSGAGGTGGAGNVATDALWDAAGDIAVGTGPNTATRLPVGTAGQVLTADPAGPSPNVKWSAPATTTPVIPGRLIAHASSTAEYQDAADVITTGANFIADVQAQIDAIAASTAPFGRVFLAPMRCTGIAGAAGLDLRTGTGVQGIEDGYTTLLVLGGLTDHLFDLADVNVHATWVANIIVDGNGAAGGTGSLLDYIAQAGGVFTADPSTDPDPIHTVTRLRGYNFGGGTRHGIKFRTNTRVCHVADCDLFVFSGNCYDLDCVDSHFSACHGGEGTINWIVRGTNNRFDNCKGFFSNEDNWEVAGQRNALVGCEAQDGDGNGFLWSGGRNVGVACVADRNGVDTGKAAVDRCGHKLTGSRNRVQGESIQYLTGASRTQMYGAHVAGNYNALDISVFDHDQAGQVGVALASSDHQLRAIIENCTTGLDTGTGLANHIDAIVRAAAAGQVATMVTGDMFTASPATDGAYGRVTTRDNGAPPVRALLAVG